MRAVDTNLVVRYITRDDPKQSAVAGRLFGREAVWISKTVLLETEWVLRGAYGFEPAAVIAALESVLGLPNVTIEDAIAVAQALRWARNGMDLADALHVASPGPATSFVTFDGDLLKQARRLGLTAVSTP